MRSLRENLHRQAASAFVDLGREHRLLAVIRDRVAARLASSLGYQVQHGPFTGFSLSERANWGASDHPLKVLGLYEQEVQQRIAALAPFNRLFCLGAADGFYAVGMVKCGLAQRSLAWDIDAQSRTLIAETATLNGVAERVGIFEAATHDFDQTCGEAGPGAGDFVLIDIEGAEYDVLQRETLTRLAQATILIELHPFLVENGEAREAGMLANASENFEITYFNDCVRDLGAIDELADFSDDMRWLLCSEAREKRMRWAILTPKNGATQPS